MSDRTRWCPPYSTILTVIWPFGSNFGPKQFYTNQESSTASDFELPCKPLLGPSPELMQPQSSLRVVQGSIVWHQHVRGACSRLKWEVLGWRGLSEAIFALAVPAWHRTVNYRNYGKLRSSQIVTTPWCRDAVTPWRAYNQRLVMSKIYLQGQPGQYKICKLLRGFGHLYMLCYLLKPSLSRWLCFLGSPTIATAKSSGHLAIICI